jgi:hypothetical protein
MGVSLEQARTAKKHLAARLTDVDEVNGIGIVLDDGDYGLKVNLLQPACQNLLPPEVDGVKVSVDVVSQAFLA